MCGNEELPGVALSGLERWVRWRVPGRCPSLQPSGPLGPSGPVKRGVRQRFPGATYGHHFAQSGLFPSPLPLHHLRDLDRDEGGRAALRARIVAVQPQLPADGEGARAEDHIATETASACVDGCGIGSPLSTACFNQSSMLVLTDRTTSSNEAPPAVQPGRSGT